MTWVDVLLIGLLVLTWGIGVTALISDGHIRREARPGFPAEAHRVYDFENEDA